VVVSVGTGYAQTPSSPQTVSRRLGLKDRFFPRLFRLFDALLNAQGNWNDHLNRIDTDQRHKYFRVNMLLEKEPLLDDVEKIPEIESLADSCLREYDFSNINQGLFAASFFFELYQRPSLLWGGNYVCKGAIRCRSPNTQALIRRILDEYPGACFTAEDSTDLGDVAKNSLCNSCGRYCKLISLKVCHPDQCISIYLSFNGLWKHRISGFPQSISRCAERQCLDADFGRADHQVLDYTTLGRCECESTRRKRKRPTYEISVPRKRSRLE
jgi:hypothetical protein